MIRLRLYNPAHLDDAELKASFVVRRRELDELVDMLRHQPEDGPLQHVLIIGARGMGKTSLCLRFLLAVREDEGLASRWQPVPFFEESYGISDLASLWLMALRHLAEATGDPKWARRADKLLERERDPARLGADALAGLIDFRSESGRKPILFVDNLDQVFDQFVDRHDAARLRAVLQERSDFMLVGTANSVFGAISSRSEPFYEFFRLIRLEGLGRDETRQFLQGFAARPDYPNLSGVIEREPGRIEAIRRLTSGNPRLIALSAQLMNESPLGRAHEDLERLIDEQTPYFKARIEQLSRQARLVFHVLAAGWAPMLAREVADAARLSSSHASAQLKQLVRMNFVDEEREPGKKLVRYQVKERFYNIYYLLRFTRDQRDRLKRLIDFIADMYGPSAYANIAQAALARLRAQSGIGDEWLTFNIVARHLSHDSSKTQASALFREALRICNEFKIDQPEVLTNSWEPVVHEREAVPLYIETARDYLLRHPEDHGRRIALAGMLFVTGDAQGALEQLDAGSSIKPNLTAFRVLKGVVLNSSGRPAEAESVLRGLVTAQPGEWPAWIELGTAMTKMDRWRDAASAYRKVTELNPAIKEGWLGLGRSLVALGLCAEAEPCLRTGLEVDGQESDGWLYLGAALLGLRRHEDAERALRRAIEVDPCDARAWVVLANHMIRNGRLDEAESALSEAQRVSPDVMLLNVFQGKLLTEQGKIGAAEKILKNIVQNEPTNGVAWAFLSDVYIELDRWRDAEDCIARANMLAPNEQEYLFQLAIVLAAQGNRWNDVFRHLRELVAAATVDYLEQVRGGIALILTDAMAYGYANDVRSLLLECSVLGNMHEPILLSARRELGDTLPALPAEMEDAVRDLAGSISDRRKAIAAPSRKSAVPTRVAAHSRAVPHPPSPLTGKR